MNSVPVSRLSNDALIRELRESVDHDCSRTARQVALIAEVERRRLFAPAGHPSMFEFCVNELHLSEDAAYKRIRVARAARKYPQALAALADGRVHLSGLTMLVRYFRIAPVDELLRAATHKSKKEIEQLLAERFPSPDLPALVHALPQLAPSASDAQPLACAIAAEVPEQPQMIATAKGELAPGPVGDPAILSQVLAAVTPPPAHEQARVAPLAPQRYGVQFTLDQTGHDLLRHVQNLLGNRVSPGDLAEVIVRALKVYAAQLEKQKFAATERPVQAQRPLSRDSRHVPSRVKRAVWKRDSGRCTYVSDTGTRCDSRWDLEFDHEQEYARGGEATVANIRLRCRAHNQHAAERMFGVGFMNHKRELAAGERERAAAARPSSSATPPPAP